MCCSGIVDDGSTAMTPDPVVQDLFRDCGADWPDQHVHSAAVLQPGVPRTRLCAVLTCGVRIVVSLIEARSTRSDIFVQAQLKEATAHALVEAVPGLTPHHVRMHIILHVAFGDIYAACAAAVSVCRNRAPTACSDNRNAVECAGRQDAAAADAQL